MYYEGLLPLMLLRTVFDCCIAGKQQHQQQQEEVYHGSQLYNALRGGASPHLWYTEAPRHTRLSVLHVMCMLKDTIVCFPDTGYM